MTPTDARLVLIVERWMAMPDDLRENVASLVEMASRK
jgi:hypothetical protein